MAAFFVFLVPTTERTKLHESVTRCKQGKDPVLCDTLRGVYHVCTSCPVKNALVCVTFAHMCKRNTAFQFVGQTTILPECTTCKF